MRAETATDRFYQIFVAAFEAWSDGQPYMRKEGRDGDFVQLAALQKRASSSSNPAWLTDEQFTRATRNYFASKLAGARTLADLAARFSIFWREPVDSFGKPLVVERSVGPGAATPAPATEFTWPHPECEKAFVIGRWPCADCDRDVRAWLARKT